MIKKLFVLPLALVAAVSLAGPASAHGDACGDPSCCKPVQQGAAAPKDVKGTLVTTTYKVDGMHCESCVNHVNTKLSAVPGVSKVEANLEKKTVTVVHAQGQADLAKLQAAVGKPYKLAVLPAAAPADDCCGEGDACKDEPKTSAAGTGDQCKAECKAECSEEHAPAKPAPAKPAPKK
jgi:copper chaperone CopZ